jgi:hypothetical protein
MSREAQNELNRRAAALGALSKHPSWPELEAEVGRKVAKLQATAARIALSDEGADQRKLDTIKGTIAALRWLIGVPKTAESTVERFVREQLEQEAA